MAPVSKTCNHSRFLILGVLLLLVAATVSCGETDITETPQACAVHEDCELGYICDLANGVCVEDARRKECGSDFDCVDPENPNVEYICYIPPDTVDGMGSCIPLDTPSDGDGTGCALHSDCPLGQFCNDQGHCEATKGCTVDADCESGFECQVDINGDGQCMPIADGDSEIGPSTCTTHADCATDEFCVSGKCEDRFPACQNNNDCWPGQTCNLTTGKCEGDDPLPPDGDDDTPDGDDDTTDGDIDTAPDGDTAACVTECNRTSDCPGTEVCGPGGCCVPPCTAGSCEEGECNPNNGLCEFCSLFDPPCASDKCCNYNVDFWYCGTCCVPPCADGYVCQVGTCVPLQCPECPPNFCCSAETAYLCVACGGDPDTEVSERGRQACLPANAPCMEGVDLCCSGTCLMGTCL